MKKIIFVLCFLINISVNAQNINPDILNLVWQLAAPSILNNTKDPLKKEITKNAVQKLIYSDIKGASLEICNAIYKVKNIKVANKEFLSLLEKDLLKIQKNIQSKDFTAMMLKLTNIIVYTQQYIDSGTLAQTQNTKQIEVKEEISQTVSVKEDLNKKLYISGFGDYVFYIPDGNFTEAAPKDMTEDHDNYIDEFDFDFDDGTYFFFNVERQKIYNKEKEIPIEKYFEKIKNTDDANEQAAIQSEFNIEMEKKCEKDYGVGELLVKAEKFDMKNFKGLIFSYGYTQKLKDGKTEDYMAIILYTIHYDSKYYISFDSPMEDCKKNSVTFAKLMETFILCNEDVPDVKK